MLYPYRDLIAADLGPVNCQYEQLIQWLDTKLID